MPPTAILQKPVFAVSDPDNTPFEVHNQAECDKYITLLTQINLPDEFYCIHYSTTRKSKTFNLDGKLGYTDISFSQLLQQVHPLLSPWYEAFIEAAMLVIAERPSGFLKNRFTIRFPLKHKESDKFYLIKHDVSPFHLDQSGNTLSFFSHFHIISHFWWEPLLPEIAEFEADRAQILFAAILDKIRSWMSVTEKENLSSGHFDITDAIQKMTETGQKVNDKTIADHLNQTKPEGITPATVHRYLNEIKTRLKWVLKSTNRQNNIASPILDTANALAVINFCKGAGILDLLRLNNPQQAADPKS